jgi:type I restriction enzyme S subunit
MVTPNQHEFESFKYIDISSVDRDLKVITGANLITYLDAPSRARQVVAINDVLVSTVRPSLNAVALVPASLDRQICSTGFCSLRADETMLDAEFLFAWVRSPTFIQLLTRIERGIGYPAVSDTDIKRMYIPLPPLSEQRRIVAILRQADRLRQLRREADEKAQRLLPALFYEMFGDPATNPKGWSVASLENVCVQITDGTHQPPPFTEEGIPFLFVSNIVDGEINLNTTKHISQKTYEALMKRCPIEKGDVLYSTVGSYGVPVVVETDQPFAFQRHIALIKPDRTIIDPLFLRSMLNSSYVKAQVNQRVRGIAQATLNLGEIAELRIYVPPLVLQQEFANKARIAQIGKTNCIAVNHELNTLFQSLLAQAFSGELTEVWREEHKGLESIRTDYMSSIDALEIQDEFRVINQVQVEEGVYPSDSVEVKSIPARYVHGDLSDEQRKVFDLINKSKGYCTIETLKAGSDLPLYVIREGLQLLTQLGLVQAVQLPDRPIRNVVYVPVYRALDERDQARTQDLDVLQQELEKGIMQ